MPTCWKRFGRGDHGLGNWARALGVSTRGSGRRRWRSTLRSRRARQQRCTRATSNISSRRLRSGSHGARRYCLLSLRRFTVGSCEFRAATDALFESFDYLLFPCAPMSSIAAGADHSATRPRILRYTTPISLAGLPVVVLPTLRSGGPAGGIQLIGPMGSDAALLALSASLSEKFENGARLHP